MSSPNIIFVYGTLKQGFRNHALLENSQYLGHAITRDAEWQMHSLGGFPGVVHGDKRVTGELYSVDGTTLFRCDRLEGHPHFYKRELVLVKCYLGEDGDEDVLEAWMYIFQGKVSDLPKIEGW